MVDEKQKKNKRAMTQLKAYFLIINVVVAVVAFGWLVSGANPSSTVIKTHISGKGTGFFGMNMEGAGAFAQEYTVAGKDLVKSGFIDTIGAESLTGTIQVSEIGKVTMIADGNTVSGIGAERFFGKSAVQSAAQKGWTNSFVSSSATSGGGISSMTFEGLSMGSNLPGGYKVVGVDGNVFKIADASGFEVGTLTGEGSQTLGSSFAQQQGACQGPACGLNKMFSSAILGNLLSSAMIGGIGALIGGFIGGNGAEVGFLAGFGGSMAYHIMTNAKNVYGGVGKFFQGTFGTQGGLGLGPGAFGVVVAAAIFVIMYKDTSTEVVEFNCMPYQPPIGGDDCKLCNNLEECSEYTCKSLGQACELLNAGSGEEKCEWINPGDVNSPKIKMTDVTKGHTWVPDVSIRPPATGVTITPTDDECIKAFTALEFTILTNEPAQCKIDYNLTTSYEEMSYYIGGSNLFNYNHTEKMSLPSPAAVEAIAPELKNDGTYTLYARCKDANGNFNQDAYSIRFCVEKGPDTTPARIESLSIPSNTPIGFNNSELDLKVYVNEPAECRWSREDRDFTQMENDMNCVLNLGGMNSDNLYTCETTLTGIEDRSDNEYYFRCSDQPKIPNVQRNNNTQSYLYNVIGTQPLNILDISPNNETIKGSTDTLEVMLEVETDNGYQNGEAFCGYYNDEDNNVPPFDEDYILFSETGNINKHTQGQSLVTGTYVYYIKCFDLGGNAAYDSITFDVETDRTSPAIIRAYKESGELKILTDEEAECSYSHKDCNFDIVDGVQMSSFNDLAHTSEWLITKNYYIRCNDKYNNQPDPNACSLIVRPYKFVDKSNVIEL